MTKPGEIVHVVLTYEDYCLTTEAAGGAELAPAPVPALTIALDALWPR